MFTLLFRFNHLRQDQKLISVDNIYFFLISCSLYYPIFKDLSYISERVVSLKTKQEK